MDNLTIPASLLMALFVGTSLLKIGLSIPLIRRRVKPNFLYGFRTRKTLGDQLGGLLLSTVLSFRYLRSL